MSGLSPTVSKYQVPLYHSLYSALLAFSCLFSLPVVPASPVPRRSVPIPTAFFVSLCHSLPPSLPPPPSTHARTHATLTHTHLDLLSFSFSSSHFPSHAIPLFVSTYLTSYRHPPAPYPSTFHAFGPPLPPACFHLPSSHPRLASRRFSAIVRATGPPFGTTAFAEHPLKPYLLAAWLCFCCWRPTSLHQVTVLCCFALCVLCSVLVSKHQRVAASASLAKSTNEALDHAIFDGPSSTNLSQGCLQHPALCCLPLPVLSGYTQQRLQLPLFWNLVLQYIVITRNKTSTFCLLPTRLTYPLPTLGYRPTQTTKPGPTDKKS
ncbi:hypothetical protein BD289DRAFT_216408 [Coniella lustricola]|uniref:Uncharacterized protein n=1 Tax=Coniella lustricola TaxID=2025994 RepID=A0A2T3AB80_9PEZI|nr:hypothetical protein BD289DRAFT_216408 [Coniella lustricola]